MPFIIMLLSWNVFAASDVPTPDAADATPKAEDAGSLGPEEALANLRAKAEASNRARHEVRQALEALRELDSALFDEELARVNGGAPSTELVEDPAQPGIFKHVQKREDRATRFARMLGFNNKPNDISSGSWENLGKTLRQMLDRGILKPSDAQPERVYVAYSEKTGRKMIVLEEASGRPLFFSIGGGRRITPDTRALYLRMFRLKDTFDLSVPRSMVVEWDPKRRETVWGFTDRTERFGLSDYAKERNYFITYASCALEFAEERKGWVWPIP